MVDAVLSPDARVEELTTALSRALDAIHMLTANSRAAAETILDLQARVVALEGATPARDPDKSGYHPN